MKKLLVFFLAVVYGHSCCCDSISILFYAVKVQKNPHIAKYYTDYVQNSSVKKGQVGLFQCPPMVPDPIAPLKEYDCRKWDNGIMGIGRVLKEGSVML